VKRKTRQLLNALNALQRITTRRLDQAEIALTARAAETRRLASEVKALEETLSRLRTHLDDHAGRVVDRLDALEHSNGTLRDRVAELRMPTDRLVKADQSPT